MSREVYWTACQTISGREHKIRAEIEKAEYGAFLPTFVRSRIVRGQLFDNEVPLIPGYVIFQTPAEGWATVKDIEGVHGVLLNPAPALDPDRRKALRIHDSEIARLMLGHAFGMHNQIIAPPRKRTQSRKPRPSRRARACPHT